MVRSLLKLCLLLLVLAVPAAASQDGVIVRSAAVYADASSTSTRVGKLTAGTRVTLFTRKGGWQEVFAEQQETIGWVRRYQVRSGSFDSATRVETSSDSRGFLSGLASFSRKASSFFKTRSGSTSSGTATIGVRGLSETEIKSAQADFAELEKMQQYASDRKRARAFARDGRLVPQSIKHIKSK